MKGEKIMSKNKELEKKLKYENKSTFSKLDVKIHESVFSFCDEYRNFINVSKTEREFCDQSCRLLEKEGFVPLQNKSSLQPGDKVYTVNRGKAVIAAVIGSEPIENGVNIVGAHIDSPRLDLKPIPLAEEGGFAYFRTQYYGGIKRYQWFAVPLAIHGVAALQDGTQINLTVGEDENDPVFCVSDILPHFAARQMSKKITEAFPNENLSVIIGNIACDDEEIKEGIKFNILKILYEKFDLCEEDLVSSEIEIVPAFPARDLGFDRSMVAGYGQDDRVCAYTALRAVLDLTVPKKTAVCLLVDKEEVGSMGATGMRSRRFENVLAKICSLKEKNYSDLMLRETLSNSSCLSADVGAAYDPNFPEAFTKNNAAKINCGLLLTKYTGSKGKSGASDASAEFVAKVRKIFNDNEVAWQIAELGNTDLGGGGTIAQYVANLDVDVIDCGVPLLSMHSPYEIAGKLDIYMAYKGYKAFYLDN